MRAKKRSRASVNWPAEFFNVEEITSFSGVKKERGATLIACIDAEAVPTTLGPLVDQSSDCHAS